MPKYKSLSAKHLKFVWFDWLNDLPKICVRIRSLSSVCEGANASLSANSAMSSMQLQSSSSSQVCSSYPRHLIKY